MRLRIDLAYDGTDFSGWAKQPGLVTVQGSLEEALATILRSDDVHTVVAGRTDAGVHATGQVVHVDVADETDSAALKQRLNSLLSNSGISVHSVIAAPDGFDARFSPIFRRYEYRIADTVSERDPRTRRFTHWVDGPLDVEAMNSAAESLLGLHDWTTYCKPREGATSVRELQTFRWARDEHGVLVATIQADAFCHNMVRNLVGMCVAVGRGRLVPVDAVTLRDQRHRTSAFVVLPPQGLTLAEVGYPADADLAARADQTRDKRDPV
ncbi:MAG: tRNA pseudouridine(38-40) synthase TruA [Microbacteriaceae bacterium]